MVKAFVVGRCKWHILIAHLIGILTTSNGLMSWSAPFDSDVAWSTNSKTRQVPFKHRRNVVSTNSTRLVGRDINTANLDVLEIVQAAQADAVRVVLQVDSKLNLSSLDLIGNLGVGEVVLRDAERKASGVRVDVGIGLSHASTRPLPCLRISGACAKNLSRSRRSAAAVKARLRVISAGRPLAHISGLIMASTNVFSLGSALCSCWRLRRPLLRRLLLPSGVTVEVLRFGGGGHRFRSSLTFPHSPESEQTHQELAPFRATKLSTMASLAVEPTFATVIANEPAAMLLA